jgi:hypothetical protein
VVAFRLDGEEDEASVLVDGVDLFLRRRKIAPRKIRPRTADGHVSGLLGSLGSLEGRGALTYTADNTANNGADGYVRAIIIIITSMCGPRC